MIPQHASASAWMMRGRQRQRGAAWAVLLLLASPLLPAALAAREAPPTVDKPPMPTVTIRTVQCKIPSTGVSSFTKTIIAEIVALAAGFTAGTAFVFAIPTGGATLLMYAAGATAGGVALIGGGVAGSDIVEDIDKLVSGTDQLYIKVNGQKIWPKQEQYKDIVSQQTYEIGEEFRFDARHMKHGVLIELFEHDEKSSDDNMGGFTIYPTQQEGDFNFLVTHEGEGSVYKVNINVDRKPPRKYFPSLPDPPGVPIYTDDYDDDDADYIP